MESHGKLNHHKKMSQSLLWIMIDKNFTVCILLNYEKLLVLEITEKVMENHGFFCNLLGTNPGAVKLSLLFKFDSCILVHSKL